MTALRKRARALVALSPFAIAYGCLLPSFERIPEQGDAQGGEAGSAGSAGSGGAATGGSSPGGQGTMGGEAGAPGGQGGGAGSPGPLTVYKQYVVDQGTNLGVLASQGLFVYSGPEDRDWTRVLTSAVDPTLSSEIATLAIDPDDGSFTFEPAAELFGIYHATYELGNAADETATGDLYITVRPSSVNLRDVADNVGGFEVRGLSVEGIGSAVAGAGDVDGDGFDDFLVGAPLARSDSGRVYVVFGGLDQESFDLDPSSSSDPRYAVIEGASNEGLGASVSGAGDLDGDGLGDFIVGAPGELGGDDGAAYVVLGRARSELSGAIADVVAAGGFSLTRSNTENVGARVAGGDDLTGDDVPDLVVFASSSRTFYVVNGTTTADVDLASDAEIAFRSSTSAETAEACSLSLLGDVDGDSNGELLVGTGSVIALVLGPASTYPPTIWSTDFMVPGHGVLVDDLPVPPDFSAVSRAADFDGDGVRDSAFCRLQHPANDRCRIFLGWPVTATDGVSVQGFGGGEVRVAGGGETSGDALADLLFSETDRSLSTSSAWVLYGRDPSSSTLSVQTLGVRGFAIEGATLIESIALGGDIDGPARDGSSTTDWLVGDTGVDGGNGRVSVIFGGEFSR
jgi:hypothetical protein